MKIAILIFSKEKDQLLPGTSAIRDSMVSHGHSVTILCETDLHLRFGKKTKIYHHDNPIPKFDAVLVRPIFNHDPSIHSALIRQFELNDHLVINDYLGVHRAKNKIRTLQLLAHHGLPMPKTALLFGDENLANAIKDFTFPVVVKSAYGTGGSGIFICESKRSLQPVVEYVLKNNNTSNHPIKIQEYIKEAKGKDLRLFVVGKKVIAAMERKAKKGEFRANFHKGGSVKSIKTTKKENKLAIDATTYMGLNIAGVDILRSKQGPLILEVNSAPGLEGITKASGTDVAGEIVSYIERRVRARRKKRLALKETVSKQSEA